MEYRQGFGDLEGEFWWGNEKLQSLTDTESSTWELVVDLEAFDGDVARVHYGNFSISGNTFDLHVENFEGLIAGKVKCILRLLLNVARVHYDTFSIIGNTFDLDIDVFEDLIGTAGQCCSRDRFRDLTLMLTIRFKSSHNRIYILDFEHEHNFGLF